MSTTPCVAVSPPEHDRSIPGSTSTVRLTWHVPAVERSVPLIRGAVADALHAWGPVGAGVRDCLLLSAGELTTNVVVHAGGDGPMRVDLTLDAEHAELAVSDHDSRPPRPTAGPDPDAESGRGLLLVRCLAEEEGGRLAWTPRPSGGKRVSVSIPRGTCGRAPFGEPGS